MDCSRRGHGPARAVTGFVSLMHFGLQQELMIPFSTIEDEMHLQQGVGLEILLIEYCPEWRGTA